MTNTTSKFSSYLSSLAMTRRRKKVSKRSLTVIKKKSKISLEVEKQKLPIRRYEPYHERFLNCNEIKDYLFKLQKSCPSIIHVRSIGTSAQGRPIYMAIISEGCSSNPKMGTMIVAGTNGTEWMTISSALFFIEQLVKGRSLLKIMDYYIIPCSNPDAYECSLRSRGKQIPTLDLSRNFPFSLGIYDFSGITDETFLKAIIAWKLNFKFDCPERLALMKAFIEYQVAIKLFISLQGNGTKITYPYGFCAKKTQDVEDLKKVAKAGQTGIKGRCFGVGSMFDLDGLCFGTMVDYIRMCQSSIKFTYVIHVNRKENVDPCKILAFGQDLTNCVRFMARNVYLTYHKNEINTCNDFFTFNLFERISKSQKKNASR